MLPPGAAGRGPGPHPGAPLPAWGSRASLCSPQTLCCVRACAPSGRFFPAPRPLLRRGPCPCAGPLRGGPPAAASRARSAVCGRRAFRAPARPGPRGSPRLPRSALCAAARLLRLSLAALPSAPPCCCSGFLWSPSLRCGVRPSGFARSSPGPPFPRPAGFGPGGFRARGPARPFGPLGCGPSGPGPFCCARAAPACFRCGGVSAAAGCFGCASAPRAAWASRPALLRPSLSPDRCALWLCSASAAAPSVRLGARSLRLGCLRSVRSPLRPPAPPPPLGAPGCAEPTWGGCGPPVGCAARLPRGASPGAVLPLPAVSHCSSGVKGQDKRLRRP